MQNTPPPFSTRLLTWLNKRFPLNAFWQTHFCGYYVPKNLNFWYGFGFLALCVLIIQIVSGIFLVMHYKPDAQQAFQAIEDIMRDVPGGWFIRYLHTTGASMLFLIMYLHLVRSLLYGSYRKPRELVWLVGMAIFLCLMTEAFCGYLLPWGQMSYWSAQVIFNLFSAIPVIGPDLATWVRGDYGVSDVTLNRFFAFHIIALPLIFIGLILIHLIALRTVGANNPDGIEIKQGPKDAQGRPLDGVPFHPYYTVHNLRNLVGLLLVFATIVFFAPEMGGYWIDHHNALPANSLQTPTHLTPLWYFTPFYAMLRAVTDAFTWVLAGIAVLGAGVLFWLGILAKSLPRNLLRTASAPTLLCALAFLLRLLDAKFWGVMILSTTVVILFFLPWLDRAPVKSIRYRPSWHKVLYGLFMLNFIILGYLGLCPPNPIRNLTAQMGTLYYLAFFLLMPFWSRQGKFKAVPERVTYRPRSR